MKPRHIRIHYDVSRLSTPYPNHRHECLSITFIHPVSGLVHANLQQLVQQHEHDPDGSPEQQGDR